MQALLVPAEKDFQIVAAALMILNKGGSPKHSRHWIGLLKAPDVATRRFAVEKLHGVENAAAAKALLLQMRHPDRGLREAALKTLLSFAAGRYPRRNAGDR